MIKLSPVQLDALRMAATDDGVSSYRFGAATWYKLSNLKFVYPDRSKSDMPIRRITDAGREYLANYTDLTPRQLKQLENWYYNLSRGLKSSGVHGGSKTNADLLAKGYLEEVPADETGATAKLELSQKGIMYFEKSEAASNA